MVMLEFWAVTLSFIGKFLIAVMALLVHWAVEEEGRIDGFVVKEIRVEMFVGSLAIFFLISGYALDLFLLYS